MYSHQYLNTAKFFKKSIIIPLNGQNLILLNEKSSTLRSVNSPLHSLKCGKILVERLIVFEMLDKAFICQAQSPKVPMINLITINQKFEDTNQIHENIFKIMTCWTNDMTKNIKTAFQRNVSLVFTICTFLLPGLRLET